MNKVDLHIHTNYSDGIFSPQEVLEFAAKSKYNIISITDHDTLEGYFEVKKVTYDYGIKIIPGIEVSSIYQERDIHILAYDIDVENKYLLELLQSIQKARLVRAKQILHKLDDLNIHIDFERVSMFAGKNDLIARPHIARAMVENGSCKSTKEAFDKYLGNESPAYVLKQTPSVKEIIDAIHDAGGVAVLAHPHTMMNDNFIDDFVQMGLDGLEVFYAKYDQALVDYYDEIAMKNGLIRTGGSDFHGEIADFEYFGEYSAPHYVVEEIKFYAEKYK